MLKRKLPGFGFWNDKTFRYAGFCHSVDLGFGVKLSEVVAVLIPFLARVVRGICLPFLYLNIMTNRRCKILFLLDRHFNLIEHTQLTNLYIPQHLQLKNVMAVEISRVFYLKFIYHLKAFFYIFRY